MTTIAADERASIPAPDHRAPLSRAAGLELLGEVSGSGYRGGASLVRRPDGQMVQLGSLGYTLLELADGHRNLDELADAMCERLRRACEAEHVSAIAEKLHAQGLLAGSEANAPSKPNPLLALRWKVVVTDPALTRHLTAPFGFLFRPVVVAAVLAAFLGVCWFVLVEQGVAAAAAHAFDRPELILLVFVLGVASAGFHELGHATACRYGGGAPGAMGAGIYVVWPAFYTDVTDAYRLPRADRLRTDLGGLYFNAIVAVATLAAWSVLRIEALLLLIGLQLVEMTKQLSPVIRADGYHILSDITGVPDLYAHLVPTLTSLVPGRGRSESALTGRARLIVTAWVLVVVPILLMMLLGVVLLLPRIIASAWASGSQLVAAIPAQLGDGQVVDALVSVLRVFSLTLPVLGGVYIAWRLVRGGARAATSWSRGRPRRRAIVALAGIAVLGALVASWWPSGQYEPIRANDRGTLGALRDLLAGDGEPVRATAGATRSESTATSTPVRVPPGTHMAVSLVPRDGASDRHPAIFVITDPSGGGEPIVITSPTAPTPAAEAPTADAPAPSAGTTPPATSPDAPAPSGETVSATAFRFQLPDAPGEDDSQALAVNRTDGGIVYSVAYSLVTVRDGDPVDQRNGAHAYANCVACTTVAVSFQVVLVVGDSDRITPINIAEALNGNCPACVTTAIANQVVVSVGAEPSDELLARLGAELERLDSLDDLGADATPAQLAAQVASVQDGINRILREEGLLPEEEGGAEAPAPTTPPPGDDELTGEPTEPAVPAGEAGSATTEPATEPTDQGPAEGATGADAGTETTPPTTIETTTTATTTTETTSTP